MLLTQIQITASPSTNQVLVEAAAPQSNGRRAFADSSFRFMRYWEDTSDPFEFSLEYNRTFGGAHADQIIPVRLTPIRIFPEAPAGTIAIGTPQIFFATVTD